MSLEDILIYIESEVEKEIETLRVETEKKLLEIEDDYRSRKEKLLSEYEKKLSEQKSEQLKSALTAARIKGHAETLSLKRKILDDFYNKLWDRVISMDDESKRSIYLKLLSKVEDVLNSKLVVSKSDANLWERLKPSFKHIQIEETDEFKGGFIHKKGNVTLDYTLENIFENFRKETEIEVAKKIFEN